MLSLLSLARRLTSRRRLILVAISLAAISLPALAVSAFCEEADKGPSPRGRPECASEEPEANVALGKTCTLEPAPNYPHSTDPEDAVQLTDGKRVEGYFWTQRGCVGWSGVSPAIVTIDLGRVEPISGVSYSTAAGVAGVSFPEAIWVLTSEDGRAYRIAGDLVALGSQAAPPPTRGYALHTFRFRGLKARGRFVKLLVAASPFTFVDEIEVYRGPRELLDAPLSGKEISDPLAFVRETRVVLALRRRLSRDLDAVAAQLKDAAAAPAVSPAAAPGASPPWEGRHIGDDLRRQLEAELGAISKEIPSVDPGPLEKFSTAFPIEGLHRRIFAVQAALWGTGSSREGDLLRKAGQGRIMVWQSNRWDPLSPTDPPRPGGAALEVRMMSEEYRSAALNLSSTLGPWCGSVAPRATGSDGSPGTGGSPDTGGSPRAVAVPDQVTAPDPSLLAASEVLLRITGLPAPLLGGITVHEVIFTDTLSGTPVAAAMPLAKKAGDGWIVRVDPGLTRQVWLTFRPSGVPAGEYRGTIELGEPCGETVPLLVKIYPFDFPARPALHLGGWDYTDRDACYEATPENRDALIAHLRERFVDTPWAQSAVLPPGSYDAEGRMVEPPSTAEFEKWRSRWPDARNYYVFAAVGSSFAGLPMGTSAFRTAVGEWIRWWAARWREWGIEPRRIGLLLVDEPCAPEQDRIIIQFAKAIRAAEPDVTIWEDPLWQDFSKATPELFEVLTAVCPNLPMWMDHRPLFEEFYGKLRRAGKRLWLYSCSGPGKLLDPYAYHRLQHWFCFRYRAEGSGFWAFGDSNGSSSWNEYLAHVGAYTPVFLDRRTVTPGKHMEAIREGVEDYEYLGMLRDRIEELDRRGFKNQALDAARRLLEEAPVKATACMTSSKMIFWAEAKDRSLADELRVQILEALEALRGK